MKNLSLIQTTARNEILRASLADILSRAFSDPKDEIVHLVTQISPKNFGNSGMTDTRVETSIQNSVKFDGFTLGGAGIDISNTSLAKGLNVNGISSPLVNADIHSSISVTLFRGVSHKSLIANGLQKDNM